MSGPTFFTSPPPCGRRYQPAAAFHDGECYFLAGWDGQYHYSDVWRTVGGNPGGAWGRIYGTEAAGGTLFPRRSYLPAQSFNGHLHFVGGYNPTYPGKVIRDHWSYSGEGRACSKWDTPPWEAREAHGLAAGGGVMMLSGGVTYSNPDPGYHLRAFDDVWKFDANGDWSLALSAAPWGKRRSHAWEYIDGHFYLFGGFDSQNNMHSTLWKWDGVNTPVQLQSPPSPAFAVRGVFFSCAANGRLWVMGGANGATLYKDVWSYDPVSDVWEQHADAAWSARAGNRCLVVPGAPDKIVIAHGLAGTPSNRIFLGDVWSSTDGENWTEETGSTIHVV